MLTAWEVIALAAAVGLLFTVVVRSAVKKESPRMDRWDHMMLLGMLVTFIASMWRLAPLAFRHVAESFF